MKTRKFISTMMVCLVLLLVFAVGLVACDPNNNTPQTSADTYYLSLKSTGFETYANAEEIPAGVLLENKDGKYSVSIALKKDEEFTVNKLGGNEKLGYSAIFSSAHQLAEGSDGNIKVTVDGAYDITLAEGAIAYSFTPYVASVQIAAPASVLELGQEYQFAATVKMTDDSETDGVSWSTSNAQVASVSESGLVTALAVGNATIKATSTADTSKFAEYAVQVIQGKVDVQSVTVSPEEVLLDEGETAKLTEQILPDNATDKLVIWESDNLDVATVDGGTVTALSPGIAHITVRTRDGGKEATATVTVRQPVTHMTADSDLTVVAGGVAREVSVNFLPSDATIKDYDVAVTSGSQNVTYNKADEGKLLVTGVQQGSAKLKLTSKDNAQLTAEVNVTVLAEGSPLVGMQSSAQILINEEAKFELVLENITSPTVTWKVDNTGVASVSGNGTEATVTGLNWGTAHLTATVTASGKSYTAQANILVSDEWYFIYGVGFGSKDWDWEPYLTDKNLASKDELLLEPTGEWGKFSITRELTPEQSFQIIYPNVASYVDTAENWNKDFKNPATQYDAANSSDKYVENTKDQFKVNTAGIYTITLDLSGSAAKISIKLVTLSVTDIVIAMRQTESNILRDGIDTYVDFSAIPSDSPYDASLIKWEVTSNAAGAVVSGGKVTIGDATIEFKPSRTNNAVLTLSMRGDVTSNTTLTVKATYKGIEASIEVPVLKKEAPVVPVSTIEFEQEHYYINVNNGGNTWETTVKASVNSDATVKGVTYSSDDTQLRVDSMSGTVRANAFGTFTVKATSVADNTKTATVLVTVYSDSFYLVGIVNRDLSWDKTEPFAPAITTLEGSAFADYVFTANDDKTEFEYRGILTSKDVFQIVFLGMDANWTNCITAAYYDDPNSDDESWIYENDNVQVDVTGIYSIKLDLSGKKPKFSVNYAAESATSLSLDLIDIDSVKVSKDDTFKIFINYTPNGIIRQDEDFKWSVDEGYEGYLDIDYQWRTFTAVITVLKEVTEVHSFALTLELDKLFATQVITLLPDDFEEVPPTKVTFEQEHYYFNVNNGGEEWMQVVKASVDSAATIQGVKYRAGTNCTVDAIKGEVRATRLGTYTVYATANGDSSVEASCKVTFYSDSFYLIGEIGDLQTFTVLPPSQRTVTGIYSNYKFEQVDETNYRLERSLRAMQDKSGNVGGKEYGFQIAYLGCESTGANVIKTANLNNQGCYHSSTYLSVREGNMRVKETGVYIIELDLSASTPKWTINFKDQSVAELKLGTKTAELRENGSVTAAISYNPNWIKLDASSFSYAVDEGYAQYVKVSVDAETLSLNVNVLKAEKDKDVTFNITLTYGEVTANLAVTVIAQHHLELTSDDTAHWYRCTDDGCEYTEGREEHQRGTTLKHDGKQHYLACDICGGGKQSIADHFEFEEGGWFDGAVNSCEECGFKVFEVDAETGTLTKYNGEFEKVRVPATIDGVTITKIGNKAFANNTYLKEVDVTAVTKYGNSVFEGCTALTSVKMPDIIEPDNGWYMFRYCSALESIRVPLVVKQYSYNEHNYQIGSTYMFDGCPLLKTVTFAVDAAEADPTFEIADALFRNCKQLTGVTLPEGLHDIGDYAFQYCESLGAIHFHSGFIILGKSAFAGTGYTKYTMDEGTSLSTGTGSFSGWLGDSFEMYNVKGHSPNLENSTFYQCVNLKSIVIPESYHFIGMSAFYGCTSLETVVVGTSVEYFSSNNVSAFEGCTSLKTVLFRGKIHYFTPNTFGDCRNLEAVYIGSTQNEIENLSGNNRFVDSDYFTKHTRDRMITDLRGNKPNETRRTCSLMA